MRDKSTITGFMTITELYFKMVEQDKTIITREESEWLTAGIGCSNLAGLFNTQGEKHAARLTECSWVTD